MSRVMIVLGTRPEAIKLAPLILALRERNDMEVLVCATSQHREMLTNALNLFGVSPDFDLDVMTESQSPSDVASKVISGVRCVIEDCRPDWIIVQGDTTTAFAAAVAGAYSKVLVGHVEAGLRTDNKSSPFPEEMNRRAITVFADAHFAPTTRARANLLDDHVSAEQIWLTGNTGIDAFKMILKKLKSDSHLYDQTIKSLPSICSDRKLIIVTAHRRESFGEPLRNICIALRDLLETRSDIHIVYPVHPNPNVRDIVESMLREMVSPCVVGKGIAGRYPGRLSLINPVSYVEISYLLDSSYLVLTDSGGIQEEAASIGKPILVTRDNTERPEGVEAGVARIVGTSRERIKHEIINLLDNQIDYLHMAKPTSVYGDGQACFKIASVLANC